MVLGVTIPSIHAAYYSDFVVWENILKDVLDSKTILLNGPRAVKVLDTAKYFSNIILDGFSIVKWEWDLDYNGITFNPDPSYNNRQISLPSGSSGTGQWPSG